MHLPLPESTLRWHKAQPEVHRVTVSVDTMHLTGFISSRHGVEPMIRTTGRLFIGDAKFLFQDLPIIGRAAIPIQSSWAANSAWVGYTALILGTGGSGPLILGFVPVEFRRFRHAWTLLT